jgi:hypothetical protein
MDYKKQVINQQGFFGGTSFDKKIGTENSMQYLRGFDWRKNPSELVQAMQARQIDSGNLDGLPVNMVQVITGERFLITDTGSLWLIKTDNTLLRIGDIGERSGVGMVYRSDTDLLYIAGVTAIHAYGFIQAAAGDRAIRRNFIGTNKSTNTSGSYPSIRTGGAATYTLPVGSTSINEGDATKRLNITSDIEPLETLRLKFSDIGTGDVTVVMHDPLNRVLATKTLTAAQMTAAFAVSPYIDFDFSPVVELLVKPNARIYHYHAYVSTGTTKVVTATADDFNTADFEIDAQRLVPTRNGFHAMEHFLQYIAIQNGRYLSLYEPLSDSNPDNTEYLRHKLTMPDGFEGLGMAKTDEFLIQAYEKVSTDPERISNEGLLVFYDGLSGTYNFYIELTEGAPQALFTKGNIPHIVVGGTLYVHLGGKELTRVRDLPFTDNDFTGVKDDTRLYPYSMGSFKKIIHLGFPGATSNEALEYGIYNYGSLNPEFPSSFGLQYMLSHGSLNTDVGVTDLKIGMVRGFGDELYIGWQKTIDGNVKYGLDIIDSNCKVASSFKAKVRQFDARNIHKEKGVHRIVISTNSVPTGTTVQPTYTLDDGTEVVGGSDGSVTMVAGDTQIELVIDSNFHVIDYGLQGTSESTVTSPLRVKGIALEWDPLSDEDIADAR